MTPSGRHDRNERHSDAGRRHGHANGRAGRQTRARPVGPVHRLAVHPPDNAPLARDQHLSVDLGDPALIHRLHGQPAGAGRDSSASTIMSIFSPMRTCLGELPDHGAFRLLDDRAAGLDRPRARVAHQPEVPRPQLLDDGHPAADDVVPGGRRQLLDLAVPAADRAVQLSDRFLHRRGAEFVHDDRQRRLGALDDRAGQHLDVDALCYADLPRRAALDSRLHLRGGRGGSRVALGGNSGRSPCRWSCPSSCSPCCSRRSSRS